MDVQDVADGVNGDSTYPVIGSTHGWLPDDELFAAMLTDTCVLITGRPDVSAALAHRIYAESGWRHGRFTVIDCAQHRGLETRLVTLLARDQPGPDEPHAELSQAETVFLQEVGKTPDPLQAHLADQLGRLRIGGQRRRRVIASTSECLAPRVARGAFDARLFYRLNTVHLRLADHG